MIELQASDNSEVQSRFEEGLNWCYGFHQEQAQRCFEQALDIDPDCALARWGVAYSIAPFYNRPWGWYTSKQQQETAARGHHELQLARSSLERQRCKTEANTLALRMVDALALRYQQSEPVDTDIYQEWMQQHAEAMQQLQADYPGVIDLKVLTAESLMNCTPWQLWDIRSGQAASKAHTMRAINVLDAGMELAHKRQQIHPGLLHLYVHALEMSPQPEKAQGTADLLRTLSTPCAHLNHMASHIDIQTGRYRQAMEANTRAIELDLAIDHRPTEFYQISRLHNYHLKLYAAMMAGCRDTALQTAIDLTQQISVSELQQEDAYLAISLEGFYANQQHAKIRFGCWQDIIDSPAPPGEDCYLLTHALHHYAVSVAHAALGNTNESAKAGEQFHMARERIPDWHIVNNNKTQDTLQIADHMQQGERLFRQKHYHAAFEALRAAVDCADHLNYCEPWAWMHPPRHALGALLLERNEVTEARLVYETDLGLNSTLPRCLQNRNNIWSLHGLHECLVKLGETDEVKKIQPQLQQAQQQAEITITASCCCRRGGV